MKHSLEKDRCYLRWCNRRAVRWIHGSGYSWFKQKYLPAVKRAEQVNRKKDRFLLSRCYYEIGDVHDFNHCPLAAIAAYECSYEFDPKNSYALRELGGMLENIGRYRRAVSVLKKSQQINPNNKYAQDDYEYALGSFEDGGPSLYNKGNILWKARELLAKDKPEAALRLLKNQRSIPARQTIACAHGMLKDIDGIIEQWQRIAKTDGKIEMEYADWFYIGDDVWDCASFWEIIAECARRNRFDYGVWWIMDSLWKTVIPHHPNENPLRKSKASLQRCNKRIFLMAQYHNSRVKKDFKLARKLSHRYTNWLEIRELTEKLTGL